MGFVEETGAAQHYRDARILAIYEGTNGIQSIDLVMRKLPLSGGETVKAAIARYRAAAEAVAKLNDPAFGKAGQRLREAVDALERATRLDAVDHECRAGRRARRRHALSPPLRPRLRRRLPGRGGAGQPCRAAGGESDPAHGRRIRDCRFFAENTATERRDWSMR